MKNGWKLIIAVDKKDKTGKTKTPKALFNLKDNIKENEKQNLLFRAKYASKVKELFNLYNTTRNSGVKTKI